MSTREVIGALPISNLSFAYRVRYERGEDVKKERTGEKPQVRRASPGMPGHCTRNLIRVFVATTLCAALVACALMPVPEDLPAIAFEQEGLYRLEVALLVFYGCLLLITPAFSGLIRGQLPIEISTHGARFADEDERSTKLDEAAIERLESIIAGLAEALAATETETERLSEIVRSDSRQPGVHSGHD